MEQIGISESNMGLEICGVHKKYFWQSPFCIYIASHLSENKVAWQEVEDYEERVQSNLRGYLRSELLLPLLLP